MKTGLETLLDIGIRGVSRFGAGARFINRRPEDDPFGLALLLVLFLVRGGVFVRGAREFLVALVRLVFHF